MINRSCSYCGTALVGRSDKRFCDAHCRNSFNNKVKREKEQFILQVNKTLRRNRRILQTLSPEGKSTVRKTVLLKLGFQPMVFNSVFRSKNSTYYFCYDYGFSPFKDDSKVERAIIIKKQPYMENAMFNPWSKLKS